jgi:hypothetical protein
MGWEHYLAVGVDPDLRIGTNIDPVNLFNYLVRI